MVARITGSMVVSVAVLIVVSLLVCFGVLWSTRSVLTSAAIGTMCGLAAAISVDALHAAVQRAGERLGDENDRPSGGEIADHGKATKRQRVDPKGSQR